MDRMRGAVADLDEPDALQQVIASIPQLQSELGTALTRPDLDPAHREQISRMLDDLARVHGELIERWLTKEREARSEILAESFHDLRSPLTSVLFLSEALQGGHTGSLNDGQFQQARLIYSAALTVLNIVENVLDSHRLEARTSGPKRTPFSVTSVREEIERVTRPLADVNRLQLEFEQSCYAVRLGDPDIVRRILLNLVSNAISYTERGGVMVRLSDSGERLSLQVEDSGPGIERARLDELLGGESAGPGGRTETQAAHEGGRPFSGSGLGLAICQRLTHMAGGKISAESQIGEGTRFTVELPFPALEGVCAPPRAERIGAA